MKIAHLSDIHWRGIQRHNEYIDAFQRLFKTLKEDIKPDLIVNTGDSFHTKTQGITPEIIERLSWMFNCMADIAPTVTILGNHDGNLTNSDRQDIISPIHEAINHPQAILYKKSGAYSIRSIHPKFESEPDIYFHVYSPFDVDGWVDIKPLDGKINIALFHGSIVGCEVDTNFRMYHCERDVSFFHGMDFVLLGDIHKQQSLATRPDKNGEIKPWVAYPGSLIQQNFGEQEEKGFLTWDINDKDDWNVKFVELENLAPFVTAQWTGTVASTLRNIKKSRGVRAFLPGSRFRISSSQPIQQVEARQIINELREHQGASEIIFKCDQTSKMELVETAGVKILKTDLRHDAGAILNMYEDFIRTRTDFSAECFVDIPSHLAEVEPIIRSYLNRLNTEEPDVTARNVMWSIKSLEFDNIFRFGEGNVINFADLNGIVGIFGPNRSGKSSCIGALMYGLFNTTDRGPMKAAHIINKIKKRCAARLLINVSGHDYIIERETVRSGTRRSTKKEDETKTATALNLYRVEQDGSLVEMNSITRDDTDKEIRKLIGTSSDFLLTAFSNQGGGNRFIEEGATQRKAILSRFLDLDIFEKLNVYAKEDYGLLDDKTKRYSVMNWSSAIKRLKGEISICENRIKEIESLIHADNTKKDELKIWISEHSKLVSEETLEQIKELQSSIATQKALVKDFERQQKNAEKNKDSIGSELEKTERKLSTYDVETLSKALVEIESLKTIVNEYSGRYSIESLTLENQKKTIKSLDIIPCGEEYPECHFIKDSLKEKNKFLSQEQLVKELQKTLSHNQKLLEKYASQHISEQVTDARKLERRQLELKAEFETAKSKLAEFNRSLLDAHRQQKEHEDKLGELQKKASNPELKWLEKNKALLATVSKSIETNEKEKREFLVNLGGKTEQLNKLLSDRSECEATLVKLKLYDNVQNAFSKNGIPAMALMTQLPAINAELAKILEHVVDFKVTLETDTSSNIMDVYIEDGNSRRIIELASGMEKMISSLALRVALLNLSSLPRPDVLILDEGFGSLDEESAIKCMELLNILRTYFKSIFVISHVNSIKEVADRLLEIRQDNLESFIQA